MRENPLGGTTGHAHAEGYKPEQIVTLLRQIEVGIMGAVSVTKANTYFFGGFFEPVLGVQMSGGAAFGSQDTLHSAYKFGTPVDITTDFPTNEKRATGAFVSLGVDLGIFRKVFGKVTGIGTSASTTQGK